MEEYTSNRDEIINDIIKSGFINYDSTKEIFLTLLNGGDKKYRLLKDRYEDEGEYIPNILSRYKIECIKLHKRCIIEYPDLYNQTKLDKEKVIQRIEKMR